jgi:Tol biopolymer transport system component
MSTKPNPPFWSVCLLLPSLAAAQSTERVSVSTGGVQGNALSNYGSISADGRYVVFESQATNLVTGDTGWRDVFLRDRSTGATTRVSVGPGNLQANGDSEAARISADGSTIGFASYATNLASTPTPHMFQTFVQDRVTGLNTCVSVDSSGVFGNTGSPNPPSLSDDGRFVAFSSEATNLVPGDTNGLSDVFVHDRTTHQTARVNVASSGTEAHGGHSGRAAISGDGRWVAFESRAADLVANDTNARWDVFVHDRQTGQTTCVELRPNGTMGLGSSSPSEVAISADGRYVGFTSEAADLVAIDVNQTADAFVRDRLLGRTALVGVDSSGLQGTSSSATSAMSADGRRILITSPSALAPGESGPLQTVDAFVHDSTTGTTVRASIGSNGASADDGAYGVAMSSDGRYVVFAGASTNLVPGDTNESGDVFVRDVFGYDPAVVICSGDGSATACPCANGGDAWRGCASSSVSGGALLDASVPASVGADSFRLDATSLPPSSTALFFQGSAAVQGGAGVAFGDGLRCAGGTLRRLGTKAVVGGSASFGAPVDAPISVLGAVPASGGTFTYQVQYRDVAAFCTASAFNTTNALVVTWVP